LTSVYEEMTLGFSGSGGGCTVPLMVVSNLRVWQEEV
jgi:hypothetical protein